MNLHGAVADRRDGVDTVAPIIMAAACARDALGVARPVIVRPELDVAGGDARAGADADVGDIGGGMDREVADVLLQAGAPVGRRHADHREVVGVGVHGNPDPFLNAVCVDQVHAVGDAVEGLDLLEPALVNQVVRAVDVVDRIADGEAGDEVIVAGLGDAGERAGRAGRGRAERERGGGGDRIAVERAVAHACDGDRIELAGGQRRGPQEHILLVGAQPGVKHGDVGRDGEELRLGGAVGQRLAEAERDLVERERARGVEQGRARQIGGAACAQHKHVEPAVVVLVRVAGEGPVVTVGSVSRAIADADAEPFVVVEVVDGEECLGGAGTVIVNLHGAVSVLAAVGAAVAEIEHRAAGVRNAD